MRLLRPSMDQAPTLPLATASREERERSIVDQVVSSLSRGNVSLQVGRALSQDDLAAGRARVQQYCWDTPVGTPSTR